MPNTLGKKTLQEWGSKLQGRCLRSSWVFNCGIHQGGQRTERQCARKINELRRESSFPWHPQIQWSCSMEVRRPSGGSSGTWRRIWALLSTWGDSLLFIASRWSWLHGSVESWSAHWIVPRLGRHWFLNLGFFTRRKIPSRFRCSSLTGLSHAGWRCPTEGEFDLAEGNVAMSRGSGRWSVRNGIWKPYQLVWNRPDFWTINSITKRIHGTGIFTYTFTIKINHSCR